MGDKCIGYGQLARIISGDKSFDLKCFKKHPNIQNPHKYNLSNLEWSWMNHCVSKKHNIVKSYENNKVFTMDIKVGEDKIKITFVLIENDDLDENAFDAMAIQVL